MTTTERYWKVLDPDRQPFHGGCGQWHPQAWMPAIPDPEPCVRGYHLCRRGDLVSWLGPVIWEAKPGAVVIEHGDKVVTDRARLVRRLDTWNDRTARLFAADCAEWALGLVEDPDDRSVEAVRVARLFAEGDATAAELSAARSAARSAAWSAARSAAWYAARSAAWDAADAARSAAWDAAWDARYAADAARSAAWDARYAADAAGSAAWDAAWEWQTDRLMAYLYPDGEPT